MAKLRTLLASIALLALQSGCAKVSYLTQAAAGQAELLDRKQPIDKLVHEGWLDTRTRRLLAHVSAIKTFGEAHGLKHTNNYREYVQLDRPNVVWVLSASEPLAFASKEWTFPITGSITYLGYFHREDAEREGARLRREGWDVDVRGASAYSTLGWFDDPVLSSMIYDGDEALGELADVILHESTHATLFIPGQSILNESIAAFVGNTLAGEYLDQTVGPCSREKRAYMAIEAKAKKRALAMKAAFFQLRALYTSGASDDDKRKRKAEILAPLHSQTRVVNNATLIQYETYGSGEAELARLFEACGRSWPRWMRTLREAKSIFAKLPSHEDASAALGPVLAAGCAR